MRASRTLWITVAATLLALCSVFAFALGGWPGQANGCRDEMRPTCFCETPRAGLVALEWVISRRPAQRAIDRRFVLAAIVSFVTAFAVWIPSLSGGPFCDPESWIQGHGIWHLLCAVAAGSLFAYFRSEEVAAPSPGH